jgi:hypothetical protein
VGGTALTVNDLDAGPRSRSGVEQRDAEYVGRVRVDELVGLRGLGECKSVGEELVDADPAVGEQVRGEAPRA